jgi:addiction module HigA family antidote
MSMKTPPHPGRIVRQECIEALGLTVTAAARGLRVTRKALSELVNEVKQSTRKIGNEFRRIGMNAFKVVIAQPAIEVPIHSRE